MKDFAVNFWKKGVVPVLISGAISVLTVLAADLTDTFHTEPNPETHTVMLLGADQGPHDADIGCAFVCAAARLFGQKCEC